MVNCRKMWVRTYNYQIYGVLNSKDRGDLAHPFSRNEFTEVPVWSLRNLNPVCLSNINTNGGAMKTKQSLAFTINTYILTLLYYSPRQTVPSL